MTKKFRIAVVVGSNRSESINRRLARALVRLGGENLEFGYADIRDIPMYNSDLEGGWPQEAARFNATVAASAAVLMVTPEHNRSIPAVLKSAIDWGSRSATGSVWRDKPIAITGAAGGAIGTALAQQHLRHVLSSQGALVMGGEAYIAGFRSEAVDPSDNCVDGQMAGILQAFMKRFDGFVAKVAS